MQSREFEFRSGDPPQAFDEVLARFKRDGCNLLVTGSVSSRVTARATRKLLGSPAADRKRLLALADCAVGGDADLLPGDVTADESTVEVVDWRAPVRSGTRAAAAEAGAPGGPNDLDALGDRLEAELAGFEARWGRLSPGEFRLSVLTLRGLVDRHDADAVARFVRRTGEAVREASGMGHYHLPEPDDAGVVEGLSPEFDARIELRQRDGVVPEQRWHVPAYGTTTDWVGL